MGERSVLFVFLLVIVISGWGKGEVELIICRHGEADHNVGGWHNSDPDHKNYKEASLTERGIQQARALGYKLKSEGVTFKNVCAAVASPLPRTQQTAKLVLKALSIPEERLVTDWNITEVRAGDRESMLITDFPNEDSWFANNPRSHNGETGEEVKQRVLISLNNLVENCRHQSGYILMFSHGTPAFFLIEALTGQGERLDTAGFKRLSAEFFKP